MIAKDDVVKIDFEKGVVIHEGKEYHCPGPAPGRPRHPERRRSDSAREEAPGEGVDGTTLPEAEAGIRHRERGLSVVLSQQKRRNRSIRRTYASS